MSREIRSTSSTGGQKGVKIERFDLIPMGPLTELARHFGRGANKYEPHQWRAGYEWSKSYSALTRHLTEFWDGKDYDVCSNEPDGCQETHPETGEPFTQDVPDTCYNHTGSHHMVAVAWHSFVLLEFKDHNPEHDDRYIPDTIFELNKAAVVHSAPEGMDLIEKIEALGECCAVTLVSGIGFCSHMTLLDTEDPQVPSFRKREDEVLEEPVSE